MPLYAIFDADAIALLPLLLISSDIISSLSPLLLRLRYAFAADAAFRQLPFTIFFFIFCHFFAITLTPFFRRFSSFMLSLSDCRHFFD